MTRKSTIDAPPERVFNYLADFSRSCEWDSTLSWIKPTTEGPVRVGSTFIGGGSVNKGRVGEWDYREELTVYEFMPDEKIVFEQEIDPGTYRWRFRHTFLLKPDGSRTRLTHRIEGFHLWNAGQSPLGRILRPLLAAYRIKAKELLLEHFFDSRHIRVNVEGEITE